MLTLPTLTIITVISTLSCLICFMTLFKLVSQNFPRPHGKAVRSPTEVRPRRAREKGGHSAAKVINRSFK